ncbi:NPP1 family protein [Massilia sp. PAMC28688]|uniref:NPP1 family protein n=1 Tax=Massilia sp. PAMC28688 TaxID=2861283 RepID=UPI001C6272B7|nr:NPP1 family protein [Massilia sp. PAMC28688]QYF93483.1 NPP1 family protein [Massilia sp. PAMC28688]
MANLFHSLPLSIGQASVGILAMLPVALANADDFPKWDQSITKYNERQVRNFHPKFDFDSDGCYAATPFHRYEGLRQNPGTKATSSLHGGCKDSAWRSYANTVHRQVCKETVEGANRVERCAHLYELYFEKDQALPWSFLGGHRHDVETVIVWTGKINGGNDFVTHVSTSAHGKYTTRALNQVQMQGTHPLVVYHKDGVGTHAFRFASADDKSRVEFLGNWGEFYAPDIISHYSAAASWQADESARYGANRSYRMALESASFGSATFKTRNDQEIAAVANNVVPRSDGFWQNTSFTINDVWWTRAQEFRANYPQIHLQIRE